MGTLLRDEILTRIADNIKPDVKRRVALPKTAVKEGMSYHVYVNAAGQIILDPQVSISAAEAWLFENKEALAAVDQGMKESAAGKVRKRGSFARFSQDAE
jgi:post-segregation antitoxin (ccd killing protein)